MHNVVATALVALGTTLLVGCSDTGTAYVPVSGVVTFDGTPVADATVSFTLLEGPDGEQPSGTAPVASGMTDNSGRYSLESFTPNRERVEGAAVGTHRVSIRTEVIEEPEGDVEAKVVRQEMLPAKYHDDTELTCVVEPSGTDSQAFDLSR